MSHFVFHFTSGKYCPVNGGLLCTSVVCVSIIGVWKILDMEFSKSDKEVLLYLLQETDFQPEAHGYLLSL